MKKIFVSFFWLVVVNEEPGVVWIKQTREKRSIVKENSNHDNDNDDKADIIRQMFRVLLREIEDFKL